MKSSIMIYDLESTPHMGLYFGRAYDVNIAKTVKTGYVMGFAWKFLGEKKAHSCYIWDFPLYKKQPRNDIEVIKKWVELVQKSSVLVGHNSDSFDNKVMMGRVMVHKLPPIALPQTVDTKKAIKRIARFDSNKLDDLGEMFGIGRKIKTDIDLWWDCMQGVKKAQALMVEYNKQDVYLTEELYLLERSYMVNHPNMANIEDRPNACPKCLAEDGFWAQGFRITKTAKYRRFQCKSCGSYVSNRGKSPERSPDYV